MFPESVLANDQALNSHIQHAKIVLLFYSFFNIALSNLIALLPYAKLNLVLFTLSLNSSQL
jgi:hypothetical protein